MKKLIRSISLSLIVACGVLLSACGSEESDVITLRVCNWEEYIDEGDWDEDELIELESGEWILGSDPMVEDFEEWYLETYGQEVKVEYSTFGTCEELYNMLTIGDVYDIASPSEYMIMKMMREGMVLPYSEKFRDESIEENYYTKGLSPFLKERFENLSINGEKLGDYAAGYMCGTLGIVYNPEEVSEEEASHWSLMLDENFNRRITIKDSVRDSYFGAITHYYADELMSEEVLNAPDYQQRIDDIINRTDPATVDAVEEVLSDMKDNVYSFETDAGKADMVTGKVVANMQWSGDAVYTMDQADEDDVELCYATPEEGVNLWFDGWILLKEGISQDPRKQHAAEAFVNFLSRPDNVVRNMYYIGYTSAITGGDSDIILEYLDWTYGADEEEEEETVEYDVSTFFLGSGNYDDKYVITTTPDQTKRQLFAQYPPEEVLNKTVIMRCFEDEDNVRINRMWTNVRCFDLKELFSSKK